MRILMHGIFIALLSGALWGGIWQMLLTMGLILTTGASLTLQIGPSILAGAAIGVIAVIMRRPGSGFHHIAGVVLTTLLLSGFALGNPFDPQGLVAVWQSGAVLLVAGIVIWLSISRTIADMPPAGMTRYAAEKAYLRLMWGQGLMLFVLIVAIPFYVMVMTSLKSQQSLLLNPLDFSIDPSSAPSALFRSYIELFTEYDFLTLLLNSAFVSFITVLITLLFSIPGAYAVARLRFPGRQWLSGSVLLIYLIPAIILVIPLYAVFSQLGLRNSLLGLCIVYPATTIPVALYMLRGYFAGLPSELDDAGLMDGLTRIQIITKIAMPLSVPAIATVALYVFMIAWNEFLFAFMFLDDVKLFTLSRGIVSLDSSEVPRQHLMAASVIATLPVLTLFLWFERFLVSGLTAGSVKG